MITRKVTLKGELPYSALHAQRFVLLANSFASSVILQDARGTFNGKSLLGALSLGFDSWSPSCSKSLEITVYIDRM